jgi:thioredoxin 1
MIEFSDEADLAEFVGANKRVVALFYASWCPFCRNFYSIFDSYAKKTGNFAFIKVQIDDDDNPLWETYNLEAVPSAIFFENGHAKRRLDCVLGRGLTETLFRDWLKTVETG